MYKKAVYTLVNSSIRGLTHQKQQKLEMEGKAQCVAPHALSPTGDN